MGLDRTAPLFRTITLGTASDYSDRMGSDRTAPLLLIEFSSESIIQAMVEAQTPAEATQDPVDVARRSFTDALINPETPPSRFLVLITSLQNNLRKSELPAEKQLHELVLFSQQAYQVVSRIKNSETAPEIAQTLLNLKEGYESSFRRFSPQEEATRASAQPSQTSYMPMKGGKGVDTMPHNPTTPAPEAPKASTAGKETPEGEGSGTDSVI